MLEGYLPILIFLIVGAVAGLVPLALGMIVGP
ncbi:MAG: NADH-quinone oxidoreductase subunit A, partial [Thioalkalivibrio sp.]|nr:NADH-quinone oxidoreductase subunit A [Thioalkalivibrio sp.]